MESTLSDILERDRRELLDLSLRNTLLSFRRLKTRGVQIVDEVPREIYRLLVVEGRTMSFLPARDGDDPGTDADRFQQSLPGQPDLDDDTPADRHVDSKLQTVHDSERLQRRLLNTFYAARSTIEELGVNTLYLALGGLTWFEDASSELGRLAPLILVPAELSRTSVRSRFRISHTGDEIGTNLSLQYKLKADYGIELPTIDAENDFDPDSYFGEVARAVAHEPRWKVDGAFVHLGFFSFTKLLMYEDLDPANWTDENGLERHPVLGDLLGDRPADDPPPGIPEDANLDEHIELAATRHIWDADSSQAVAIADSMAGANLVIQGPPGTGKSQTITNLIAECIAGQKKVLFVAEKMAALEVVKRRLDNAGLGAPCLELHSHKTRKAAVLEDLQKTMRLGQPEASGEFPGAADLREARDRLNRYCEQMHEPIWTSGVSPYKAVANVLRLQRRLQDEATPELGIEELSSWDGEEYRQRRNAADDMQSVLRSTGPPRERRATCSSPPMAGKPADLRGRTRGGRHPRPAADPAGRVSRPRSSRHPNNRSTTAPRTANEVDSKMPNTKYSAHGCPSISGKRTSDLTATTTEAAISASTRSAVRMRNRSSQPM